MACPEGITQDGFETQFGTNHLAHFLLFELLKPLLLQSSTPEFQSRVVSLSSRAHQRSTVQLDDLDFKKRGYDNFQSYGQVQAASLQKLSLMSLVMHAADASFLGSCHGRLRVSTRAG